MSVNDIKRQITEWIDTMTGRLDGYEIDRDEYLADYSLSPQTFRFYSEVVLPFCTNTLIMDNLAGAEGLKYPSPDGSEEGFRRNKLSIHFYFKAAGEVRFREIKARFPRLEPIDSAEVDANGNREIVYPSFFPYLLRGTKNADTNQRLTLAEALNDTRLFFADDVDSNAPDPEVTMHSVHGFYSILENFIRNSAKHNATKEDVRRDGLNVYIYLRECSDKKDRSDRYVLTIADSVSRKKRTELFSDDTTSPGIYERMEIIPETKADERQNLGFFDMHVNAFLLRYDGSDLSELGKHRNLELVTLAGEDQAIVSGRVCKEYSENRRRCPFDNLSSSDDTVDYRFGYELLLLKPRKILWIGDDLQNAESESISIKSRNDEGIFYYSSIEEFYKEHHSAETHHKKKKLREIAAFDFVVFNGSHNFKYQEYLEKQALLPPRVLIVDEEPSDITVKPNIVNVKRRPIEQCTDVRELLEACWQHWLARLRKPVAAFMYFAEAARIDKMLHNVQELGPGLVLESANRAENKKKEALPSADRSHVVVYDNHGGAFDYDGSRGRFGQPSSHNFFKDHTKVFFDKSSDDYIPISRLGFDRDRDRLLAYQMIDAATTNIFVLDERIAATSFKDVQNKNDDIPVGKKSHNNFQAMGYERFYLSRLCYAKVFIITNVSIEGLEFAVTDKNPTPYSMRLTINQSRVSVDCVENNVDGRHPVLESADDLSKDVLLVHRTFLNFEKTKVDASELISALKGSFGSLVITSGGGYPHSLKIQERFLPFSVVNGCLESRVSKIKLVTMLQKLLFS